MNLGAHHTSSESYGTNISAVNCKDLFLSQKFTEMKHKEANYWVLFA